MFHRDLITSPSDVQPDLPLEPRPVDELGPATEWELEQAEGISSVNEAAKSTLSGIMVAGAAYGAAAFLLGGTLGGGAAFSAYPFHGLAILIFLTGLFSFYCFMFSALTGGLSISAILVFNSVLTKGALTRRSAIVLAGGIAAYMPCALLVLGSVHGKGIGMEVVPFVIVVGYVFFAMLFAQIGAVWMANRHGVWRHLKQELQYKRESSGTADSKVTHPGFQFKIRHLMIGMIVCSCVLALDQICTHHELLVTFGLYLFLQSILLWGDWLYFSSYRKKLLRA